MWTARTRKLRVLRVKSVINLPMMSNKCLIGSACVFKIQKCFLGFTDCKMMEPRNNYVHSLAGCFHFYLVLASGLPVV